MAAVEARTVSGRTVVVWGLALTAVVVIGGAVAGPPLRDRVRQEQRPRTLREPIATGTLAGSVWEAVVHFDGADNCVELRYREQVVDRSCAEPDAGRPLQDVRIASPGEGVQVVMGVTAETVPRVRVEPRGARAIELAVEAADLGFPVGFFATELPAGGDVDRVVAVDARDVELGVAQPGG